MAAAGTVGLLLWIALEIGREAWPAFRAHGVTLLVSSEWNTNADKFGILGYLLGTLASSLIALALALPVGVVVAIFLSEGFVSGRIRHVLRTLVELLAAIPSVVYGLWGIAVVVPFIDQIGDRLSASWAWLPFFRGPASPYCTLTASLVLALMILPTITAISRNAVQGVPVSLKEGCYALGFTRWETIFKVVLPTAAPGIVASAVLGLGRALGETMAVAMLIGNSPRPSLSLLSPAGTLAGLMVNQFAEADGMVVSALMYAAVVLMLLTVAVNLAGDWILRRSGRKMSGLV